LVIISRGVTKLRRVEFSIVPYTYRPYFADNIVARVHDRATVIYYISMAVTGSEIQEIVGQVMQWWAHLTEKLASITDNPLTQMLASLTLNCARAMLMTTANFLYNFIFRFRFLP